MKIKLSKFALRICLIYVVVGGLWILFSGWALSVLISDPEIRAQWEIYKGWGFVAVTALLLYLLLRGKLWQWEHEVTEGKRTEEALRTSEHLLRLVMDMVPHFIFVKDKQSRHLLVNRACAEACKLTPEQMVGRSDLDLAPGSALAKSYMKDDQEVIASGQPKFVPEQKLTDAYGQTRFLQTTKIPFPPSAISLFAAGIGEPAILGVAVDITERKLAEEELRLHGEIMRNMAEGVVLTKVSDATIVYTNPEFEKMFGYGQGELIGKNISVINAPTENSPEKLAEDIQRSLKKTGMWNGEVYNIKKDGTCFWCYANVSTFKHPKHGAVWIAVHTDITERKRAEAAVERLASIVSSSDDAIVSKTPDGIITSWNQGAERMFGYSAAETVGKPILMLFSPECVNEEKEFLKRIRRGESVKHYESVRVRKDGKRINVSVTLSPITDNDGKIIGVSKIARDITERKQVEEKLVYEQTLFQTLLKTTPDIIYFKDRESRFVRFSRSKADTTLQTVRDSYRAAHPEVAPDQWPPHLVSVEAFAQWLIGKTDFDTYPEAYARVAYNDEQKIIRTGQPVMGKLDKAILANGKEFWRLTTKLPWHDKEDNIIGTFGISQDVTALKEAEAALNRERSLLRTLIDNLPDLIYAKDVAGRKILANPADVKTCKCQTEAELLGKTDFDHYPKDIAENFWADDRKVLQGKPVINREEYFLDDKGGKRWLLTSKLPLHDQNNEIVGLVGIGRDITERRQAEKTSAAQQKLLDSLISAIPDLVYFKDRESRFLRVNEAYIKRAGLADVHAALGKTDFDIYGEQHAREAYEDEQRIVATGQPIINKEEQENWPDGRVTWAISTKMPLLDSSGKIIGTMGISRDITDRKRAEEDLRQVNRALQTLSKCNEALVRTVDESSLLTKICQIVVEIGGYKLAWVGYVEQDDAKSVRPVAWAGTEEAYLKNLQVSWADNEHGRGPAGTAIRTGQPSTFLNLAEHPNFTPWRENALRHGFATCIGLPLKADDKTFGVICVYSSRPNAFNATETALLKELADDLAFGIATLRSRAERKQLEEQLRQSQKMDAIGQLAGGVAHDFNNMLTVIQGNASLLLNPQLKDGERGESAQQIVRAAERAASLTRQLLLFSRKQVMQAVPLNLNEVVGNMTKMLQRILGEDISLNANYASNLPVTLADPGMIEQILLNLAVNSRDAMPNGGRLIITTSVETLDKNQAEKHAGAAPGLYTCLNVTDTGCGIATENLSRIFEPFFTTKEVGKGTGLGLATVYGIIQQHHGWIAVDSQVGRGTSFHIYLPAAEGESAKLSGAAATLKLPGGNETILLVEDESPVRMLINNLLQRCGYTVLEAESGVAALAIWKEHRKKIHLLFTDMVMPEGISGRELAKKLKSDRPELKVIYTTGHSADIIGREPNLVEGINFLQKPYQPLKLAQIVRNCLDQKPVSS